MRRLIHDLNQATDKPLAKDRLDKVLDRAWPDLQADIEEALERVPAAPKTQRSKREMMAEIVDIVRRIERTGQWIDLSGIDPTSVRTVSTGSNETPPASKSSPITTVTNIPGSRIYTSYGPVDQPEEPSQPED